jgi:dTDP-4-amino-4,6-dideoxygalactose transaminase
MNPPAVTPRRRIRKGFNYVDDAMRQAALAVLDSHEYYLGPQNDAFEDEVRSYLGCRHAVAVNSGTSGMYLILKALGIGPGDEVVVPAMGFVTLAEAVAVAGATPVFAEVEEVTYNLDPTAVERAITPATKAIVPAHKYGHPADMTALGAIAARHELALVEDACHAFGAEIDGRKVGALATAGFLSFAGKSISVCGLGGMVVTDDDELATEVRLLRDHGRPRAKGQRFYDIQRAGYNLRLSELHATIGRAQLPHLDDWNDRRRTTAAHYNEAFERAGVPLGLPRTLERYLHAFLHYTVRVPNGQRDELQRFLAAHGIESSVLYPQGLHLLAPYRELTGHAEGDFPIAERLTSEVLSLPNHPDVGAADVNAVVDTVVRFYGG